MATDRELLLITFTAVCALAKRLTGDTMAFCLTDSDGKVFHLYGDEGRVYWIKEEEKDTEAPTAQSGARVGVHPTRCPWHDRPNDNQRARQQSAVQSAIDPHQ